MTRGIDPTVSGEPRGSFSPTLSEPFKRITNSAAERDAERRGNKRQGRQTRAPPRVMAKRQELRRFLRRPGRETIVKADVTPPTPYFYVQVSRRVIRTFVEGARFSACIAGTQVTTHTPASLLLSAARGCYFFIGTQRHFIYPSFMVGKRKVYQKRCTNTRGATWQLGTVHSRRWSSIC